MKYIKYIIVLSVTIWVSSCGEPTLPFDTNEDVSYGAYARRLSQGGAFDFFNIPGSSIDVEVEFYDENRGGNIQSYAWTVEFRSNGGNGGNDVAAVPVTGGNFTPADFGTSEDGLPSLAFSFGMEQALQDLGVDGSTLTAGDVFRFDATITKTDGSQFTLTNTGTNIISSATFAAVFQIDMSVVCLFGDDLFVGDYSMAEASPGSGVGGFGVDVFDLTGTYTFGLVDGSPTRRSFDATWAPAFGFGQVETYTINFVCTDVIFDDAQGTGLTCGGALDMGTSAVPGGFDITDDSQFTMNILDVSYDDACGTTPTDISYVLTKI